MSININPVCLWPNFAKNGQYGGLVSPPGTIFNGSKRSNQIDADKAVFGQKGPNMTRNGRFGGPLRPARIIFGECKGSKWPPDVATMFNLVQLVFNQWPPFNT